MSMIIGRKQIILAALVLALAAAIFLNWRFSQTGGGFSLANLTTSSASNNIGDATYVNNPNVSAAASASSTAVDIFAQAQLNKKQTRDQAKEVLKEVAVDSKATTSQRSQAVSGMQAIAGNMQSESNIETLIKAKGFKDCVAFINNGTVNIVVKGKTTGDISQSDIIQIKDIVLGQTNISADNIRITQSK